MYRCSCTECALHDSARLGRHWYGSFRHGVDPTQLGGYNTIPFFRVDKGFVAQCTDVVGNRKVALDSRQQVWGFPFCQLTSRQLAPRGPHPYLQRIIHCTHYATGCMTYPDRRAIHQINQPRECPGLHI